MRILFLCSEFEGLIKTGGLADACRGLAASLQQAGHQLTILLPRYASLYQHDTVVSHSVYFTLGQQQYGCAVRKLADNELDIWLLEHDDFFRRERPYDDGQFGYADNPERFAFFCKAALEWLRQQQLSIDIIHGHDWQTALTGSFLKQHYQPTDFAITPRFVFTIHNGAYQQPLSSQHYAQFNLSTSHTGFSMLAEGILSADWLTTVSAGYRQELMSEPAANGLAVLYQQAELRFSGILNGCDYQQWDPSTDPALTAHYSASDLTGKAECKRWLRQQYQLANSKVPLFVAVSRITGQKGFDFLIPALRQWLAQSNAQVLLVGSGEQHYCQQLGQLQQQFPLQFRFIEGFNEPLSHQVEAAGDFFLMPSLFEPCGLNQIYSLRYGTVPVVRLTGGLKDTVLPWPARNATGIGFTEPNIDSLVAALQQAEQLYRQPRSYKAVQQRGMQQNFSWQQAAEQYLQGYKSLCK
ncbi:glycogen synthase [Arsukibacterium sp.]|uniref:glycogen synthase n=1 Tax=Arsukibacterium sp. TaxID=1977258 RepID=UPI002FDA2718